MSDSESVRERVAIALEHQKSGNVDAAAKIYRELLEQSPELVPVLCLMANLERQLGHYVQANSYLARARAVAAETPGVLLESGLLALAMEQPEEAVAYLEKLLAVRPDYAEGAFNLGHAYERSQQAEKAIEAYKAAIERGVAQPWEAQTRLGSCLVLLGREHDALAYFDAALAQAPEYAPALFGKGMVQMAYGEFAEAGELFEAALKADPERIEIHQQLVELKKFDSMDEPVVRSMQALLAQPGRDDYSKEKLHFGLGKVSNDCGQYDTAFQHYAAAKAFKGKRQPAFDREHFKALCTGITNAFAALPQLPVAESTDAVQPVFIIGMPRSGTTLVEQSLSCHSQISGAGELAFMESISRDLGGDYPGRVAQQSERWLRKTRDAYIALLQSTSPGAALVTDKYPANFLHIGLISHLFPNARFIHCRRNPLDTCLSIYFQDFSTGNYYANDLEDTAFYYACYAELMTHWLSIAGSRIHEVQYEAMVDDQPAVVRATLGFIGLEWEDACLHFHKNPRKVSTMSRWQVRQPVYKGSRDRWRHYEAHLAPLLKILPEN